MKNISESFKTNFQIFSIEMPGKKSKFQELTPDYYYTVGSRVWLYSNNLPAILVRTHKVLNSSTSEYKPNTRNKHLNNILLMRRYPNADVLLIRSSEYPRNKRPKIIWVLNEDCSSILRGIIERKVRVLKIF